LFGSVNRPTFKVRDESFANTLPIVGKRSMKS
jgi:hypothetical protein